jgi:hypothetical protein
MTNAQLYLPTVLPQWSIFAGVVLITVGYVDKRALWTFMGWIALIIAGLVPIYFNLFGGLSALSESTRHEGVADLITFTGWQAAAGGVSAIVSLILFHYKSKRYPILAILTILYFILIFFLYTQVSELSGKINKTETSTEIKGSKEK